MKYEETSRRIREAMNEKHITAAELSRQSGVGKASLSQYINGSHCPHNDSAYKLSQILNVDPIWLMGFDVPKHQIKEKAPDNYLLTKGSETAQAITIELSKLDERKAVLVLAYLKALNGGDDDANSKKD